MYKAVILTLARQDIKEAAQWYNQRQLGLGKRFVRHIREKINFVRENPKAIPIRYTNVRTAVLEVFPYMIHFVVDDENKRIIVSAVLSVHRNPTTWRRGNE